MEEYLNPPVPYDEEIDQIYKKFQNEFDKILNYDKPKADNILHLITVNNSIIVNDAQFLFDLNYNYHENINELNKIWKLNLDKKTLNQYHKEKYTLLMIACMYQVCTLIWSLLFNGIDRHEKNIHGMTAFDLTHSDTIRQWLKTACYTYDMYEFTIQGMK